MALKKKLPTEFGVDANYHKVSITAVDWHKKQARIETLGFIDEAARDEGKQPVLLCGFDCEGAKFDFDINKNIVAQAYEKVKLEPRFEGAEDV